MIAQIKVEMMTAGYATILCAFNALTPYPLINAPHVLIKLHKALLSVQLAFIALDQATKNDALVTKDVRNVALQRVTHLALNARQATTARHSKEQRLVMYIVQVGFLTDLLQEQIKQQLSQQISFLTLGLSILLLRGMEEHSH
jgi:hypothetical protein